MLLLIGLAITGIVNGDGHTCVEHDNCADCLGDDTVTPSFQCVWHKGGLGCAFEMDDPHDPDDPLWVYEDGNCPVGGGNGGDCSKNPNNPKKKCKRRQCCFSEGCVWNQKAKQCLAEGEDPVFVGIPTRAVPEYTYIEGVQCRKNRIKIANKKGVMKTFKTKNFLKAKQVCDETADCVGISDPNCDDSGKFYLCKGIQDDGCTSGGGDCMCCRVEATDFCYWCDSVQVGYEKSWTSDKGCVWMREGRI